MTSCGKSRARDRLESMPRRVKSLPTRNEMGTGTRNGHYPVCVVHDEDFTRESDEGSRMRARARDYYGHACFNHFASGDDRRRINRKRERDKKRRIIGIDQLPLKHVAVCHRVTADVPETPIYLSILSSSCQPSSAHVRSRESLLCHTVLLDLRRGGDTPY